MSNANKLPHGHQLDPAKQKNKHGLLPKQEAFCQAYLIDFNVAAAERRVGLAKGSGAHAMANPKIRARIHQIRLETGKAFDVTRERLLQELMAIVYADPREVMDDEGKRVSPKEWSNELSSAIAEVEFDLIGDVKKVKRYDKTKAIELLMRMLGYASPEIVINKNLNYNTEPMDKADVLTISKQLEDNL